MLIDLGWRTCQVFSMWLLCSALAAQGTLVQEIQTLQTDARQSVAYEVVSSLTTEVGPRLAGSPAEVRARAWAVKKLSDLGFENVRVEHTSVTGWQRKKEIAYLTAPYPQPLAVTALGLSVQTPEGGLEAPVVRFESLAALESSTERLDGKIVFIDEAMPKTQDGSGYGAVVAIRSGGPRAAAKRGALGVLIRSVGTDSHRFPHTGMLRYGSDHKPIPAGALSAPDADQLARIFATTTSSVSVRLELGTEFTGEQTTGPVIGEITGETYPKQIILLGAHLDSWDLGTGALDDGAGVGIVIGAAKLIRDKAPKRPARTIRVVLFGAEEVGLVGARAYAKTHAEELPNHILAMESDFGAGLIYRLSGRVTGSAWPQALKLRATHLSRLKIIAGRNNEAGGPDLYPLRGSVPILSLDQDGRDYFDYHHTADDTLDKVNPEHLAQNVAAYASVAWWASESGVVLKEPLERATPSLSSAPDVEEE